MAVAARRSHGETAFQQSFPMDALRIMVDDLVFRARVPHGCFLPFLVALAAQPGDVQGKDRGARIRPSFHFVRTVAFLAGWPIRVIVGDKFAVHAALILLPYFRVT